MNLSIKPNPGLSPTDLKHTDLKPQGFVPEPPKPQHCGSPEKFAQAIGFHFADNHSALLKHLDGVTDREAKSAVYNHNEKLRDFLGIRNPEGFRKQVKQFLGFKQPEQIAPQAAPVALADAALHLGKQTRVHRALDSMMDLVHKNPLHKTAQFPEFQQSVETGFNKLLNDLGTMKIAAQGKAVSMITHYASMRLDGAAMERLARAAQRASTNPRVAVQQRMILANFAKEYLPSASGQRGHFVAKFKLAVPPQVPPREKKLDIPVFDPAAKPFNDMTGLQLVSEFREHGWDDSKLANLRDSIAVVTSAIRNKKAQAHDVAAMIAQFNNDFGLKDYLANIKPTTAAQFGQLAAAIDHDLSLKKSAVAA
jgi:hypothetical protein